MLCLPDAGGFNARPVLIVAALLACLPARAADVITAPLTMARSCPLVPVQVNEAGPYLFLLDTCLRLPVLDAGVVAHLGLPEFSGGAPSPSQPAEARRLTLAALRVAGLDTPDATCVVADLAALQQRLGVQAAGLLPAHQPGYELVLDFPARTAAWLPLDRADLTGPGDGILPVTFDASGAPCVEAVIDGVTLPLRIDTALADVVALGETTAPVQQAVRDARPDLETMLDVTGQRIARQTRLGELSVGGAKWFSPVCACLPGDAARLGMGFLRQFRVTLNFEHGLAQLQRDGSSALADPPLAGFGLSLGGLAEGLWWLHVALGSPASAAGLRAGDRLVAVDGVSAVHVPAETLEAYLRGEAGQEREFTIDRTGQTVQVRLAATRLL